MEFVLGLLTGILVGFIWGVWRTTQSVIERIMERPEEIRDIIQRVEAMRDQGPDRSAEVQEFKTEWHDDVCYLYDHDDRFLAQGSSVTEAIERAQRRFPELKLSVRVNRSDKSTQNT